VGDAPGGRAPTRIEPGRSIHQSVAEVADRPGVLGAVVWVGCARLMGVHRLFPITPPPRS
jgi:hypothetical protein